MSNSKYLLALGYTLKETWDSIVKTHAAWPVSDLKSNRSSEDAENHRESVSMSVMKKSTLHIVHSAQAGSKLHEHHQNISRNSETTRAFKDDGLSLVMFLQNIKGKPKIFVMQKVFNALQ